ncbi:MAG: transcription-repair coupling factor [Bacilli bacterium]|nr:transcription-repair coupling factor [Bacilli bacterium]
MNDILNSIFKYDNHATVCGLTNELNILYYYQYYLNHDDNVLILSHTLYEANKIFQKLKTYTDDVCLFPMDDFLASVALAISPDLKVRRLETLEQVKTRKKSIIVTNLMGYLRYLPAYSKVDKFNIQITRNEEINRNELLEKLDFLGYHRDSLVSTTGEYAVRGFIIDIFPIESEHPIRIEFFGDEIESIRYFSEDSQLSINDIDSFTILPFEEVETDSKSSLVEYLQNPFVFFVDEQQILNTYKKIKDDIREYIYSKDLPDNTKYMFNYNEIVVNNYIKIETINNLPDANNYNSRDLLKFKGDYDKLKSFCLDNIGKNTIILCLSKEKQIERIMELFPNIHSDEIVLKDINVIKKKINEGFIIDKYVFISEYDIEDIKVINNYKNSYKMGSKIKSFDDIKIGDYVVHSLHGIGIYGGIKAIEKAGMVRDYIMISYLGNDKVYVPVEKISSIYKYADANGTAPKINKLNSATWAKTKLRVRNKIKDISDELIKLYAVRSNVQGIKYNDYEEELIFGANFEYNETSDQLKCIKEIDADLKSYVPMDRLLCGDVGFGKTEVAFRAIFKTIMNGYQVAYLCPTTLLSRQQYLNALERFKDFPFNIALLNRFTSTKEVNRIISSLNEGKIDIVFGTHKLLNEKIKYKNLGLLIIDEEQRFGVTHKEKIKELKNDINVLTLSATPIPRTLKMAMSGLRDLSIIDTPPVNRYPVQTYVLEENEVIIKDAIYKELAREGQVFILYNKVNSIVDMMTKIQMLVPESRVVIAHGQMDKNELENIVSAFVDEEYDVLICTTIIETGIDIPNVNTLVVIDADNFGLSQLYQLRGRVGRSDKIAYAYLMYKPYKMLTETAIKRLQSIKDFTELGSGYKIAMRDLAIRGAGDFLGSDQAGFVENVGLDLYTQMVQEEISRQKGETLPTDEEQMPLIEVANHISDDYVSEENIKIEIHKMISEIKDKESFLRVKEEIEDRFGTISEELEIYMYEEWFEKLADRLHINRVRQYNNTIEVAIPEKVSNKLEGDKLFLVSYNINPKFRLSYKNKEIHIALPLLHLEKHFIYYMVDTLDEIVNMIK